MDYSPIKGSIKKYEEMPAIAGQVWQVYFWAQWHSYISCLPVRVTETTGDEWFWSQGWPRAVTSPQWELLV